MVASFKPVASSSELASTHGFPAWGGFLQNIFSMSSVIIRSTARKPRHDLGMTWGLPDQWLPDTFGL